MAAIRVGWRGVDQLGGEAEEVGDASAGVERGEAGAEHVPRGSGEQRRFLLQALDRAVVACGEQGGEVPGLHQQVAARGGEAGGVRGRGSVSEMGARGLQVDDDAVLRGFAA